MDEDEKEVMGCATNGTSMQMKGLQHCDFALTGETQTHCRTAHWHTRKDKRRKEEKETRLQERENTRNDHRANRSCAIITQQMSAMSTSIA